MAYFAASVDTPEENKEFAESLELDYPLLSDPGREVARAFGVVDGDQKWASRHTVYIGPEGDILLIDTEIDVRNAGTEIVANLEELGVAKKKP